MRKIDVKIQFVTNTSKESKTFLYNRLTNLGFEINKNEIFSSLIATREIIKSKKLNPYFLVDDAAIEDLKDLKDPNKKPNAVVVGLAPEKFNYEELNKSFR